VDPFGDNDIAKTPPTAGKHWKNAPCAQKGNRCAAKENMSEDSHKRRMAGLFKTWGQRFRKDKGLKKIGGAEMEKKSRAREREQRKIAKLTVAKEARQVQDDARQTATAAFEVIKDVMMNAERDSDKLTAANIVLERAYGKATQINVNDNVNRNGNKEEVSAAELDKRIEEAIRGVEELTGGATKPPKGSQRPVNLRQRNRNSGRTVVH
jgi:hypothetical protein